MKRAHGTTISTPLAPAYANRKSRDIHSDNGSNAENEPALNEAII